MGGPTGPRMPASPTCHCAQGSFRARSMDRCCRSLTGVAKPRVVPAGAPSCRVPISSESWAAQSSRGARGRGWLCRGLRGRGAEPGSPPAPAGVTRVGCIQGRGQALRHKTLCDIAAGCAQGRDGRLTHVEHCLVLAAGAGPLAGRPDLPIRRAAVGTWLVPSCVGDVGGQPTLTCCLRPGQDSAHPGAHAHHPDNQGGEHCAHVARGGDSFRDESTQPV